MQARSPRFQTLDPLVAARLFEGVAARRLMAWVLDTMLIAALTTFLTVLLGLLPLFFLGGFYVVVNFLYRWLGLARHSATLGMRLMGLVFLDPEARPMSGATAFLHTLFFHLSVVFVFPQLISIALMGFTAEQRSLSDILLGQALVNRALVNPNLQW